MRMLTFDKFVHVKNVLKGIKSSLLNVIGDKRYNLYKLSDYKQNNQNNKSTKLQKH